MPIISIIGWILVGMLIGWVLCGAGIILSQDKKRRNSHGNTMQ
jgi:hypothetical protein